jgi:hypothetical protein
MASAKSRYYANQVKKGKITQAQASNAMAGKGLNVSSSSTPAPLVGQGPLLPGQTRASTYAGPSLPGQVQPGYYDYSNNSVDYNTSPSKSSSKKSSGSSYSTNPSVSTGNALTDAMSSITNRSMASHAMNKSNGNGGGLTNTIFNPATAPINGILKKFGNGMPDLGGDSSLGLNTKGTIYDLSSYPNSTNSSFNNPYMLGNSGFIDTGNPLSMAAENLYNQNHKGTVAGEEGWIDTGHSMQRVGGQNDSSYHYPSSGGDEQKNPLTNSRNYTPNALEKAYQSPQIQSDNATVQKMGGRGNFATGEYANGAGNYGFDAGATYGGGQKNNGNTIWDEIKMAIGGIPTANAQEIPQNYASTPRITENQWNQMVGGDNFNRNILSEYPLQNSQENQGNSQVNSQLNQGYGGGVSGADKQTQALQQSYIQQQMKDLGKQGKSQKKALADLISSIKDEYNKAVQQGTDTMNKNEGQDLLQQNAAFAGAGSDSNDPQLQQYRERMQNDYGTQLSQMLDNLSTQKNKSIKSGNSSYQDSMNTIDSSKKAAKYRLAMLLASIQKKNAQANYSPYGYSDGTLENDPNLFG